MVLCKLSRAFRGIIALCVLSAVMAPSMVAQKVQTSRPGTASPERLRRVTFGIVFDYGRQIAINKSQRSGTHISLFELQMPIRLYDFPQRVPLFRRLEVVPQAIFGATIHPAGSIVGFELPLRIDFATTGRRVFFLDAGAGINRVGIENQISEIAGKMQFSLLVRFGVRYRPKEHSRLALVFAVGPRHFSDNKIHGGPNQGPNYFAASVGIMF